MAPFEQKRAKILKYNAIAGTIIWLLLWLAPELASSTANSVARIMILAPLILVPLTLRAEHRQADTALKQNIWRVIMYGQAPCAALAVGAFFVPQGYSALMIAPWFLITTLIALTGAIHLWEKRKTPLKSMEETCIDAGRLYLPGGAVWWLSYQAGFKLLDFPLLIVLLTAMHFHFAGYMAPWLSGQAARGWIWLKGPLGKLWQSVLIGTMLGMPMIALGIQASKHVELVFVGIFTISLIIVSVLNLTMAPRLLKKSPAAAIALVISCLSIFLTMFSALAFVARHLTDAFSLTIAQMVLIHGWANGIGFALCGALAWQILAQRTDQDDTSLSSSESS